MEEFNRDFKGVWIPRKVWLDDRLNMLEKGILTEIDSLDMSDSGCFASNKHIADFCQCTERSVSSAISKLIDLGYLELKSFDGRQRVLKSRVEKFSMQSRKNDKSATKNLRDSNTSNKTSNNTESIKKEGTKETYEKILSDIEDESLRNTYYDYIKMRTLIKAPMTNRALEMLINKVQSLEPLSVERQKQLLETAILNNWKSVYPLRDEPKTGQKSTPKRSESQELADAFMNQLMEMYEEE